MSRPCFFTLCCAILGAAAPAARRGHHARAAPAAHRGALVPLDELLFPAQLKSFAYWQGRTIAGELTPHVPKLEGPMLSVNHGIDLHNASADSSARPRVRSGAEGVEGPSCMSDTVPTPPSQAGVCKSWCANDVKIDLDAARQALSRVVARAPTPNSHPTTPPHPARGARAWSSPDPHTSHTDSPPATLSPPRLSSGGAPSSRRETSRLGTRSAHGTSTAPAAARVTPPRATRRCA